MSVDYNSATLSANSNLPVTQTPKLYKLTMPALYAEWNKWMSIMGSCDDDKVQICFDALNSLEKAILSKPALSAQDMAIKVLVYSDNGGFSLGRDFIDSLKSVAVTEGAAQ